MLSSILLERRIFISYFTRSIYFKYLSGFLLAHPISPCTNYSTYLYSSPEQKVQVCYIHNCLSTRMYILPGGYYENTITKKKHTKKHTKSNNTITTQVIYCENKRTRVYSWGDCGFLKVGNNPDFYSILSEI